MRMAKLRDTPSSVVKGRTMPLVAALYKIDRSTLPMTAEDLRASFNLQRRGKEDRALVLYPESGAELSCVRYFTMMEFRHVILNGEGGTLFAAGGIGQIVITSQRIIGMITVGRAGTDELKEAAGSVYGFSLDFDELRPVTSKKNWLGRPTEVAIASRIGLSPPFGLRLDAVMSLISNDGQLSSAGLRAFLEYMAPEGRRSLQQAT